MADYKSCAWYQNETCIRDDKYGAPISCADCEDYERRVVFKIEDLQERNGEMSVRKSCKTCKHFNHGSCFRKEGFTCNEDTGWISWELADDAKADLLHDAETVPIVKENNEPEHDSVNHPSHYTSGGIECIDCIKAALGENFIGFLMGNVIKYSYRYKDKNGIEDLRKARWYLDRAIKELTENAEE
jgi:hypothetical protein